MIPVCRSAGYAAAIDSGTRWRRYHQRMGKYASTTGVGTDRSRAESGGSAVKSGDVGRLRTVGAA